MTATESEMRQAALTQGEMFHEIMKSRQVIRAALAVVRLNALHTGPADNGWTDKELATRAFWETLRGPFDYALTLEEVRAKALQEAGLR